MLMLFTALVSLAQAQLSCQYGATPCPAGYDCVHFEKERDVCVKRDTDTPLTVGYPFEEGVAATCDQGPLSPEGNSHTWSNTAFALDLQGDRRKKTNLVRAGVAGKVITFSGCISKNDQCGLGFGNQVKILSRDDHMVFYAHLASVRVKSGAEVTAGEVIGVEGDTGWTGRDNRHLHLSVHRGWKERGEAHWHNVGWLPPSVPFVLAHCGGKTVAAEKLRCRRTDKKPDVLCAR